MSTADTEYLLYAGVNLHVDATFLQEVENRKLNIWKLNTPTVDLAATLRSPLFSMAGYRNTEDLASSITVDSHSFRGCHREDNHNGGPQQLEMNHDFTPASASANVAGVRECSVRVDFYNCNTIEEFRALDKKRHLRFMEHDVVKVARADKIGAVPLTRGYIFMFADLKTHGFVFSTATPVADLPQAGEHSCGRVSLKSRLSVHAYAATSPVLAKAGAEWFKNIVAFAGSLAETNAAWPSAQPAGGAAAAASASASAAPASEVRLRIVPFLVPLKDAAATPKPLTNASLATDVETGDYAIAMLDAGNSNANYPSWVWRNVVTAIRVAYPQLSKFTLIALRGADFGGTSTVFQCTCDPIKDTDAMLREMTGSGWHKGTQQVDLSAQMDPVKLADSSANLNLSLMKWRMLPTLNLERMQTLKCLLLGSGTLGCNIARHLVMWGVRNITMVDRGNVSYSNPVRQTLFEHADCLKTGEDRVKSVAAANALRRILPTVDAKGVNLEIRMPGHRIDPAQREQAAKDIDKLQELILGHDVVFLLTDSRESRWLPSLMCAANDVPVINAALAFDSYLVMRHGLAGQGAQQVGCYFCNDVVAPIDSLSARSLDQQCTVTRPGVSAMASALAVELLSSVMNHPRRFLCPAWMDEDGPAFDKDVDAPEAECTTVLGIVPHQLRGNINTTYGCTPMFGRCYSKCTACSAKVVSAFKKGNKDWSSTQWVIDIINEPGLLERISGLEEDRKAVEGMDDGGDCDFGDE